MSRSAFPNGVDEFVELFDLPFDKVQDAKRLTELKMQAQLNGDEENELMSLTSGLEEYMITPETMNKLTDAIVEVETFFYKNVTGHIEQKQEEWKSYVNQFKFHGTWREGVSYKEQNLVINKDGDLYFCRVNHVSTKNDMPTDGGTVWTKLSSKGEKGDIGLNAMYKGQWDASKAYKMGDTVSTSPNNESHMIFIAKKDNTGKKPHESVDEWMLYQGTYVGKTKPANAPAGMHFFKEI